MGSHYSIIPVEQCKIRNTKVQLAYFTRVYNLIVREHIDITLKDFEKTFLNSYFTPPSLIARRLFETIDYHHDNVIHYHEYLVFCTLVLHGTFKERLLFAFNFFDIDKTNNYIFSQHLIQLLQLLLDNPDRVDEIAKVIKKYQKRPHDTINLQAFTELAKECSEVISWLDYFKPCIPNTTDVNKLIAELKNYDFMTTRSAILNFTLLSELEYQSILKTVHSEHEFSISIINNFLDSLQIQDNYKKNIISFFDPDGDGSVSVSHCCFTLSTFCHDSYENQIRTLCNLIDEKSLQSTAQFHISALKKFLSSLDTSNSQAFFSNNNSDLVSLYDVIERLRFNPFIVKILNSISTMGYLFFGLLPSFRLKRELIEKEMQKPMHKGQQRYLVNYDWWNRWLQYTSSKDLSQRPDILDNFCLLNPHTLELLPNLVEGKDYISVPPVVWAAFFNWYKAQTSIIRYATEIHIEKKDGDINNNSTKVVIDAYPTSLKCEKVHGKRSTSISFIYNSEMKPSDIIRKVTSHKSGRLLLVNKDNVYILFDTNSVTLGELPQFSYLVVETPLHDGTYYLKHAQTISNYMKGVEDSNLQVCGIENIGNTCFLSVVLQALAHSPILFNYFTQGYFLAEINNKALDIESTRGLIVQEFARLMYRFLHADPFSVVSPKAFFTIIGMRQHAFQNNNQQDADEMLRAIFSELHECLVRSPPEQKKESYIEVESPECEKMDKETENPEIRNTESKISSNDDLIKSDVDSKISTQKQSSDNKSNTSPTSIISDLFYFSTVSILQCTTCEWNSKTREIYDHLPLSLSDSIRSHINCNFYLQDSLTPHVLDYTITSTTTLEQVLSFIEDDFKVDPSELLIADIYHSYIFGFISDKSVLARELTDPCNNYSISIFHCKPFSDEESLYIIFLNRFTLPSYTSLFTETNSTLFDSPFILYLPFQIALDRLYDIIWERNRHFFYSISENGFSELQLQPFKLLAVNKNGMHCSICSWIKGCRGCDLPSSEGMIDLTEKLYIAIEWNFEFLSQYYIPAGARPYTRHSPMKVSPFKSSLQKFVQKDFVEYKCEKCKSRQLCTKQNLLTSLPKYLLIQFQRFTFEGRKILTPIDIPISNLKLSKYLCYEDEKLKDLNNDVSYDLYCMICHRGHNMASGHFIAYIKCSDNTWYAFEDSEVREIDEEGLLKQTSGAYVVFYQQSSLKDAKSWLDVSTGVESLTKERIHNVLQDKEFQSKLNELFTKSYKFDSKFINTTNECKIL